MFQFVTTTVFGASNPLDAVANCSSGGVGLPGCPQVPSIASDHGRTVLRWNWTSAPLHASLRPGDGWNASFNLVSTAGPSNGTPLDQCATAACVSAENTSGSPAFSGATFVPWTLPAVLTESFPLLTLNVDAAAPLTGSLVAAVTLADAPSVLPFQLLPAGGYPPFAVVWHFGDGAIENSSSLFTNHTFASTGFFHVSADARDAQGTAVHVSTWVTILPSLQSAIVAGPLGGFPPFFVSLSTNPEGGLAPYRIAWSFGDGSTAGGTTVQHTYDAPGVFEVQAAVTDSLGRTLNATVVVTVMAVLAAPPLAANAMVTSVVTGSCAIAHVHYDFAGSATGGLPPYSFVWNFGDGSAAEGPTASHAYTSQASSVPMLTVSDTSGGSVRVTAALPPVVIAGPACGIATQSSGGLPLLPLVAGGVVAAALVAAVVILFRYRRAG
jgi:PKD repeat protein